MHEPAFSTSLPGERVTWSPVRATPLDDDRTAWFVTRGTVAIFSQRLPEGPRAYLFEVAPGGMMVGLAPRPDATFGLLAQPIGEAEVVAVPVPLVAEAAERGEDGARSAVAGWLEALGEALPDLNREPASAPGAVAERLQVLALHLPAALAAREAAKAAASHAQFHKRLARDRQETAEALRSLTSLVRKAEAPPSASRDPLMAALEAIGRASYITFSAPAASEDMARVADPVEAIARASRVRMRRVVLAPPWWRKDCCPLLAYQAADERPVALIPTRRGYDMIDPTTQTREPVTEANALQLKPFAVMFYRPLPLKNLTLFDMWRFATAGREVTAATMLVLGVVASLLGMAMPQLLGAMIDQAIPDSNRAMLWVMGAGLTAAALGSTFFQVCRGLLASRLEGQADAGTQAAVWDRVLNLGAPFFRDFTVGDLTSRIMAISQIRQQLSGPTMNALLTSVFALLNGALMFSLSPALAVVAAALTFAIVVITTAHACLKQRRSPALQALMGELSGLVVQLIGGVPKLRVTGAEGRAFARWAAYYRRRVALNGEIDTIEGSLQAFNAVMPVVSTMVIFAYASQHGGLAVSGEGTLSTGSFLAFNAAFGVFLAGALSLGHSLVELLDVKDLWERARPILEATPELQDGQRDPGRLTGRVAIERLTFRYSPSGKAILEDVSLHAEPGEHIALVGPSGCGKSTIFRLLLGFETPESGIIAYDQQDISQLDLRAVRRQLGTVLQNGRLKAGSVYENIACGALLTEAEVWEAVRDAGFEADVREMPMGLHTVVAEGGSNLSGGQRQRLLIARAFALRPCLMLFDEATSALDNETQAIVSASLQRMRVTRVSIAHRLSTIRDADRIYVLDQGRVVQVGTFEQLAAVDGPFKRLVARQMA